MLPTVAIVGYPNVGKSTLFNRLTKKRLSIVSDVSGVTRDRVIDKCEWNGVYFEVMDTGGYNPKENNELHQAVCHQIEYAIQHANSIIFVVDVYSNIESIDNAFLKRIRMTSKPIFVAVNKSDNYKLYMTATEFYKLGFKNVYGISAMNGLGTGELLDDIVQQLNSTISISQNQQDSIKIAFVGKPNVGKSSIFNALLGANRSIVSSVPGTTRDSIHTYFTYNEQPYVFIDTAGLRKPSKIADEIEFYSILHTQKAIRNCDIAVVILDANEGITHQDKRIIMQAEEFFRGILIVLNKWDLSPENDDKVYDRYVQYFHKEIPNLYYCPIISVSALTQKRIPMIMDKIQYIYQQYTRKIPTPTFNRFLSEVTNKHHINMTRNIKLKIKYGVQVKTAPPVFKLFSNYALNIPNAYQQFIIKQIRHAFGYEGVPIKLNFVNK